MRILKATAYAAVSLSIFAAFFYLKGPAAEAFPTRPYGVGTSSNNTWTGTQTFSAAKLNLAATTEIDWGDAGMIRCNVNQPCPSDGAGGLGNFRINLLTSDAGIQGSGGGSFPLYDAKVGANTTFGLSKGSNLSSGATITPTNLIHHVTGTSAVATITVPAAISSAGGGCVYLIPDGAFTTNTTDNIGLASTGVVGKTLIECWDGTKWYPSY